MYCYYVSFHAPFNEDPTRQIQGITLNVPDRLESEIAIFEMVEQIKEEAGEPHIVPIAWNYVCEVQR